MSTYRIRFSVFASVVTAAMLSRAAAQAPRAAQPPNPAMQIIPLLGPDAPQPSSELNGIRYSIRPQRRFDVLASANSPAGEVDRGLELPIIPLGVQSAHYEFSANESLLLAIDVRGNVYVIDVDAVQKQKPTIAAADKKRWRLRLGNARHARILTMPSELKQAPNECFVALTDGVTVSFYRVYRLKSGLQLKRFYHKSEVPGCRLAQVQVVVTATNWNLQAYYDNDDNFFLGVAVPKRTTPRPGKQDLAGDPAPPRQVKKIPIEQGDQPADAKKRPTPGKRTADDALAEPRRRAG